MRHTKTIFFSVLFACLTQVAWAQQGETHDPAPTDPVKSVRIFPNPATDFISLKFEAPVAKLVKLELHSIIGNVLEIESEVIDDYEIHIRVKDLPTGYYLLDIKEGIQRGTFKFLKR